MPMRQLRSCDFCGDEAVGIYEAIPQELSPSEAEQRRVVLCENCLGTLETVVDPLLSRLGVDPDESSSEASTSTAGDDSSAESAATETTVGGTADQGAATDTVASETTADAAADEEAEAESDTPTASDSSSRAVPPSQFGAPEGYTDIAEYDGFDVPEEEAPEPPTERETNGVRDARSDRLDSERGGEPTDRSAPSAGRGSVGEEPREFRTVMRLLGNREFPLQRTEVVELAAGAYQLEDGHVERIIDHAIDRGVLSQDGDTLDRS